MALLDVATRTWWRAVGRRIDLDGAERWLAAPMSADEVIADAWIPDEVERVGGSVLPPSAEAGLVPDWDALAGPGFDPAAVDPRIRDFYEHTSRWRMDAWSEWSAWAWPGGELVSRLFGRRVQQLSLPTRALDVARGMDSRVTVIADAEGRPVSAGWLRTLRSTGEYVFSGCYSVRSLPDADGAGIHVAFPLESGNVQVFLRPRNLPGGGFLLESGSGAFGEYGAYVVVRHGARVHAARVPIHETFELYVDPDGVLRADHVLRLWSATAVRLHYKLQPAEPAV